MQISLNLISDIWSPSCWFQLMIPVLDEGLILILIPPIWNSTSMRNSLETMHAACNVTLSDESLTVAEPN